ncbi:helix-turn-helix domain-containing protein [Micromonospora sp. NPDC048839]|uniref:helix-turn-helix domain-containing protein n=1 Tax=Micromonospora sp. NPDC048839 TaxID=3155641 RepID=UPI00340C7D40
MADEKTAKNPLGPVGEAVQANLKRLRLDRGFNFKQVSDRLSAIGRPIPVLGLSRIERGARRVDADDLVALAIVLEVAPVTLLMPPADDVESPPDVPLAPGVTVTWQAAWRWALGEQPLMEVGERANRRDSRVAAFIAANRPHEDTPISEAARALTARASGPYHAVLRYDGVRTWSQLSYGDVDEADGER